MIATLPGSVLKVGLRETWEAPNPGWFQFDDRLLVDPTTKLVTHVDGAPLDEARLYRVGTVADFFRKRDGPSIGAHYEARARARERWCRVGSGSARDDAGREQWCQVGSRIDFLPFYDESHGRTPARASRRTRSTCRTRTRAPRRTRC